MRCLIVADLHYSLPQFDWLVSAAPLFDAVIFAGDALDVGSAVDVRAQIVVVKKYLALLTRATRVMLCSGNHDLDERSTEGEKIARWIGEVRELGVACDGDDVAVGDTLFSVYPWWDGPKAREAVQAQIERDAAAAKAAWIWVYHAPPEGSPTSWDGKQCWGDKDLKTWIETYQPDLVLSQVFVTTGRHDKDLIEIVKGIKAGDQVVTAGQNRLFNGMSVVVDNTIDPSKPPKEQAARQ